MDHEVASLCSLADETLVHICTYLPTIDIITLSSVCHRFRMICSDKAVVRISDFRSAFQLTESLFKSYLKPKIVYDNIEVLNLNYCSWLPASIFGKIGKLKKLKALHILDCQVSFAVLRNILLNHQLSRLSWTWRSLANTPATDNLNSLRQHLSYLRHVIIHMSRVHFLVEINKFIYACLNLEGLEIYNLCCPMDQHNPLSVHYDQYHSKIPSPFKKLKFFKCQDLNKKRTSGAEVVISKFINNFANSMAQWNVLWITQTGSQFLHQWWKKELLSLDVLCSADALSLSGSWPAIQTTEQYSPRDLLEWQLLYTNYRNDRNEDYVFALRFLNHREEVKCRKLSFDDCGLTPELLCTIARKCPKVEYLSMTKCLVLNDNYVDHESGAAIDVMEAFSRVCVNCSNIAHLNLAKTEITIDFAAFANLKHLTSLGISTWMLTSNEGQVYPSDYCKTKQGEMLRQCKNQTEITQEQLKKTSMWQLVEACPGLVRLAVEDLRKLLRKQCYEFLVLDAEYACISGFKQLQHLQIQDSSYLCRGAFLVHILKGCTNLVTLRLKNVGIGQTCNYIPQLTSALVYAKSLESLSILQTRLHLPAMFYDSLSTCSNLSRLRLSAVDDDPDAPKRISLLVKQLPKLNWLQVCLMSSIASCKALEKRLTGIVKQRPCFFFVVNDYKNRRSYKESGPYIYLDGFSGMDD